MASLDDGCALIRVKARFPHEVLVEANFCASEATRSVISQADVEHAIASRIRRVLQIPEAALGFGVLELHHDRRAPALLMMKCCRPM
jgi:hypothetical protein